MSPAVALLLLAIGYGDFLASPSHERNFVHAQRLPFAANELATKIGVLSSFKYVAKADHYQIPEADPEIFVSQEGFERDSNAQRVMFGAGSHVTINTGKYYSGINGPFNWRLFNSYHAPNFGIEGWGVSPVPQRPTKCDAVTTGGPAVGNLQCRELEISPDLRLANFSRCENCFLGGDCRILGIVSGFLGGSQGASEEYKRPNAKAKSENSSPGHHPLGRSVAPEFIIRLVLFFGLGFSGVGLIAYRAWDYLGNWRRFYVLLLLSFGWLGLLFYLLVVRLLLRLG